MSNEDRPPDHVELSWKDSSIEYEAVCYRNFSTDHYHLTVEVYSVDLQCNYSWEVLDKNTFMALSDKDRQHLEKSVSEMLELIVGSSDELAATKKENKLLKERIKILEGANKNELDE